jgi:hypothetical protein
VAKAGRKAHIPREMIVPPGRRAVAGAVEGEEEANRPRRQGKRVRRSPDPNLLQTSADHGQSVAQRKRAGSNNSKPAKVSRRAKAPHGHVGVDVAAEPNGGDSGARRRVARKAAAVMRVNNSNRPKLLSEVDSRASGVRVANAHNNNVAIGLSAMTVPSNSGATARSNSGVIVLNSGGNALNEAAAPSSSEAINGSREVTVVHGANVPSVTSDRSGASVTNRSEFIMSLKPRHRLRRWLVG